MRLGLLSSLLLLFTHSAFAQDLDMLLDAYEQDSDLSKITKKDSAGLLQIFTRDDIEAMQASNLQDILDSLPGIYLLKARSNTTSISAASVIQSGGTNTRLYINDHDMSSSAFGSAFLIWGEMPIEYIDHIEVYRATSSMEFGNETAVLIIRLYTKTAARDSGTKVRLVGDSLAGLSANIYTADALENGLTYFAYANGNAIKHDVYHNSYQDIEYDLKSDVASFNLFANLEYKEWKLDLGAYKKENDNFLGLSTSKKVTPTDGQLEAQQLYAHLSKEFDGGIKLQLSYDNLSYDRNYVDPNGIRVANAPTLNNYDINFNDNIFSTILEKTFQTDSNKLLIGAFYKYKGFTNDGSYSNTDNSYTHQNSFSNSLNFYSMYVEDSYDIGTYMQIIGSVKYDIMRYEKDIKNQDHFLGRIGVINTFSNFKTKLFYTHGYVPLAFYQIYNPENMPYRSNPDLDAPITDTYTASISYVREHYKTSFEVAHVVFNNYIFYNYLSPNGWINIDDSASLSSYLFNFTYLFDKQNTLSTDFSYGKNSEDTVNTPNFEFRLTSFNSYKKFTFFNALTYRTSYTYKDIDMDETFDLTSAVKYQYTQDFSIGIRGENILNMGFEQAYKNIDYSIPVRDQKFLLNLEYQF